MSFCAAPSEVMTVWYRTKSIVGLNKRPRPSVRGQEVEKVESISGGRWKLSLVIVACHPPQLPPGYLLNIAS